MGEDFRLTPLGENLVARLRAREERGRQLHADMGRLLLKGFEEGEHPRKAGGEFAPKGEGESGGTATKVPDAHSGMQLTPFDEEIKEAMEFAKGHRGHSAEGVQRQAAEKIKAAWDEMQELTVVRDENQSKFEDAQRRGGPNAGQKWNNKAEKARDAMRKLAQTIREERAFEFAVTERVKRRKKRKPKKRDTSFLTTFRVTPLGQRLIRLIAGARHG